LQQRIKQWLSWLALLGAILTLLAVGLAAGLRYWLVPQLPGYKPQIERQLSVGLGVPVSITALRGSWSGIYPVIEADGITLQNKQGETALAFDRIRAALSWRSVYHGLPVFHELDLGAPRLVIKRLADGRLQIAGLDIDPKARGGSANLNEWLVEHSEIRITGGEVYWHDELRQAPVARLTAATIAMQNDGRAHRISITGQLAAADEAASAIEARGDFKQPLLVRDKGDFSQWKGEVFASVTQANLSSLRKYIDLPLQVQQGTGSVRAWAQVSQLQVQQITTDVALTDATVQLAKNSEPLSLKKVSGRVTVRLSEPGLDVEGQQLVVQINGKPESPALDLAVRMVQPEDVQKAEGALKISRLDLDELQQLASHMNLPQPVRDAFARHAPRGKLSNFEATWRGALDAPSAYEVKTTFNDLAINSVAAAAPPGTAVNTKANGSTSAARPPIGTPGFRGLSGNLNATHLRGTADVSITKGSVSLPGVFANELIDLDKLQAKVSWTKAEKTGLLQVNADVTEFANANVAGQAKAQWRQLPPPADAARDNPGHLDLTGSFSRADPRSVARYLPLGVPEPTREYVQRAVGTGRLADTQFVVRGDLFHFPFNTTAGEFRITTRVDDLNYSYVPTEDGRPVWPAFSAVKGQLIFDKASMQIKDAQARVFGVSLSKVNGSIADFSKPAVLTLEGTAQGPLDDLLKYVQQSPLNNLTGRALAESRGKGEARLDLKFKLPLSDIGRSEIDGRVTLPGNDFTLSSSVPTFAAANGMVQFSDKGFSLRQLRAQFLGGEVALEGGSRADDTIQVSARGTATAEGLRRETSLGIVSTLAGRAEGSTRFEGAVTVRSGRADLNVTTSLQGMALNLPAPLGKTAEQTLPVRYASSAAPAGRGDELAVTIGPTVEARYERRFVDTPSGPAVRVTRGAIGVNNPASLPDSGVFANLKLPRIDMDAWLAVLRGLPTQQGDATDSEYAPTTLAFVADELVMGNKTFGNVVVGASLLDGQWQANAEAKELSGYFALRMAKSGAPERLIARLARLSIPQDAREVEALLDEPPDQLPALDVVIEDLDLRGKKLGRLEMDAVNRAATAPGGREWRLNRLAIINPESTFNATGNWVPVAVAAPVGARTGGSKRVSMQIVLDVANAGGLLSRMGIPDAIRGGKGRIEGNINWIGSPLGWDLPTLGGELDMKISDGQFLKQDPGIARLLSVLSLQTLPRRITLDFRDVFSEGFSFDEINAYARIERGVVKTNNFRMKGPQAVVLIEGEANIARETQSLFVVIEPDVNIGAASLGYALINPAVGLTTFILQWFARDPLRKALAFQYRVTGSWSAPTITKVDPQGRPPEGASETAVGAAQSRNP
jgi:uncharacterized protein (TIGR02099 family)